MGFIDRLMKPILKRIVMNRWDYNEEEYNKAGELGLFDVLNLEAMKYWIKADPVCSDHCSGCHNEGRPFYFNALGLLIKHKCPSFVCIHGLSQISPLIYTYYDKLLEGKDPNDMVFKHVTCTDIGLEMGGLGKNFFRVTVEKMPFIEFARFMLTMSGYLLYRNRKARGRCLAIQNAPVSGGPPPSESMKQLPLDPQELEAFLASPERVKRLQAIEKFRDHRIVIRVIASSACLAGHREGDEFLIDPIGVVGPPADGKGVCIMALHKAWWRVLLMLERMAAAEGDEEKFASKIFDLPMNCYGAGLPLGPCGEILMRVEVRKQAWGNV